jgi:hypothetical protein
MTPSTLRNVGSALADKARGDQPGRLRAFVAAVAAGITVAVLTYRVLRS